MNLFEDEREMSETFRFAEKVPYKFSYIFTTEDCKRRTLMIEDWETGMLYRNVFQDCHNEETACQKVREKYLNMAKEIGCKVFGSIITLFSLGFSFC